MSGDKTCSSSCTYSPRPTNAVAPASASPKPEAPLARSVFRIPGMDCPAEEQMIRLRLADAPVASMAFDLAARTLVVDHAGDAEEILRRMEPLGYGAELQESKPLQADDAAIALTDDAAQARVLWTLLGINAMMFVVEAVAG